MFRRYRKEKLMENLIIESDNLIAMRKLLPEYEGKIDVMPIDPPYNTNISYVGYKDFDSRWNVFMRERLEVAYKLLSKFGVMFIHIDENECVDLYHICLDSLMTSLQTENIVYIFFPIKAK